MTSAYPRIGLATHNRVSSGRPVARLITGGDSGTGRAVALAYAREGADVALSYLPEEESDALASAEGVEEAGRAALHIPGDVAR